MIHGHSLVKIFVLLATIFLLDGCSDVTNVTTYPSPDGRFQLTVVTELQGANDPAPWWTHISLQKAGENPQKIPGNIANLEGRIEMTIQWTDLSNVEVRLRGVVENLDKIRSEQRIEGIKVLIVNTP